MHRPLAAVLVSTWLTCRPFESANWTAPFRRFFYFSPFCKNTNSFRRSEYFVGSELSYSDLLNNFALCELEAGQENVWSRDLVRRYKKQNNVSNVKHGLLSPYRVGHVPPHNPVYICIVQESYKSNRQPNNSKGNHLSPISSFTRWGPFSSCYFSYIMPSQMSRAWWAPKPQKIH